MRHTKGKVVDFDEDAGLGHVQAGDGSTFRFHCTQILNGTRAIAVGAEVEFSVVAGRHGTWEAAGLRDAGGGDQGESPAAG